MFLLTSRHKIASRTVLKNCFHPADVKLPLAVEQPLAVALNYYFLFTVKHCFLTFDSDQR
jgi:hypothetical protein